MRKSLLKFSSIFLLLLLVVSPVMTHAQDSQGCSPGEAFNTTTGNCDAISGGYGSSVTTTCTNTGISKIICQFQQFLNSLIPLLVSLGVVYFVWGVVQYVIAGGEEAKTKGRDRIIYGVIGLAVIVGLWGLVNIVVNTFGLSGQSITVPTLAPLSNADVSGSSCTLANNPKLQDLLKYFGTCIINNSIIPFIFAVAVLVFLWGIVKFFIINADEEAKREQGKQFILWGIIAIAVMLSFWGLVGILRSTFNVNTGGSVLPQVKPPSN